MKRLPSTNCPVCRQPLEGPPVTAEILSQIERNRHAAESERLDKQELAATFVNWNQDHHITLTVTEDDIRSYGSRVDAYNALLSALMTDIVDNYYDNFIKVFGEEMKTYFPQYITLALTFLNGNTINYDELNGTFSRVIQLANNLGISIDEAMGVFRSGV